MGAAGDESVPGQATGRWAVMEADILGPDQTALATTEPFSSLTRLAGPLQRLASAWPAWCVLCRWALIGWRDPGSLPVLKTER